VSSGFENKKWRRRQFFDGADVLPDRLKKNGKNGPSPLADQTLCE
jgi:hypothetical protein